MRTGSYMTELSRLTSVQSGTRAAAPTPGPVGCHNRGWGLPSGRRGVLKTVVPLSTRRGVFCVGSEYLRILQQAMRHSHGLRPWCGSGQVTQVRSGQVRYSAEIQDHESHNLKAAWATSEVSTGLNLATLE